MFQQLPPKSPSFVGKYTIQEASGIHTNAPLVMNNSLPWKNQMCFYR